MKPGTFYMPFSIEIFFKMNWSMFFVYSYFWKEIYSYLICYLPIKGVETLLPTLPAERVECINLRQWSSTTLECCSVPKTEI